MTGPQTEARSEGSQSSPVQTINLTQEIRDLLEQLGELGSHAAFLLENEDGRTDRSRKTTARRVGVRRNLLDNVDTIDYTDDPETRTANVPFTISGKAASSTVGVSCEVRYTDPSGIDHTDNYTATLNGTTSTWITAQITLPYASVRYLFIARFMHMQSQVFTMSALDHYIET
jgi:hypothetical protein